MGATTRRKEKRYAYLTNCVGIPHVDVPHLGKMIENAREIAWSTFIRKVGKEQIAALFPFYCWHGEGLHLKDDWAVHFYSSTYKGRKCVYIEHSAIEYIFI